MIYIWVLESTYFFLLVCSYLVIIFSVPFKFWCNTEHCKCELQKLLGILFLYKENEICFCWGWAMSTWPGFRLCEMLSPSVPLHLLQGPHSVIVSFLSGLWFFVSFNRMPMWPTRVLCHERTYTLSSEPEIPSAIDSLAQLRRFLCMCISGTGQK